MTTLRPPADRDSVEQSIREIRAYHKVGCRIYKRLPARGGHGTGVIRELAVELGWNETRVHKARQFADPELGYTAEQLTELCDLVREHRPLFGTAFVGVLVTVKWEEGRADLQRRCIEENWSKSELEAEIKRRFGNRRFGGRRRRVVAERGPLLVQLAEMTDTWRRWFSIVSAEPDDRRSTLNRHLSDVDDEINAVTKAMGKLEMTVTEKLRSYRKRARA